MPNYKIISSPSDPVYEVNIYEGAFFANSGNFYMVSTDAVTVSNGRFLVFQLKNPQNSGKTLYISSVLGGGSAASTISILKNATISGVTSLTIPPQNTNFSFANNSVTNPANYYATTNTTDPTSGGALLFQMRQAANPHMLNYGGQIIIPSSEIADQYFYVKLLSTANNSILSISVSWWEL